MATAWQTVEEAALTLGISSRTLHRRMSKGELETRLENGRREVLVVIPQPEDDEPIVPPHWQTARPAPESVTDMASEAAVESSQGVEETMLALHEDRIRRTDLAIMAYQQSVNVTAIDARRAHRNSRIAWGVAGGIIVGMFLAGTWATHTVTRAHAEVEHLNSYVRQLSASAETKTHEVDELRKSETDARVAAARVEGELTAAKNRLDQISAEAVEARYRIAPSTQPVTSIPPVPPPTTAPVSPVQH